MDKEHGGSTTAERDKDKSAHNLLDPTSLFSAYWGRDGAANASPLFSGYPSAYGSLLGRAGAPGFPSPANHPYGTLSVAASQAANLGLNPASAAWWSMAQQLAAQDYLMQFAGLSSGLVPPAFAMLPGATPSPTSTKSPVKAAAPSQPPPSSTPQLGDGVLGSVRLPPDTEIIKYTSSRIGPRVPGTTNRGRKKTISLDQGNHISEKPKLPVSPPPIGLDLSAKSKEAPSSDNCYRYVEHEGEATNGAASPPADLDAPLNLSLKPDSATTPSANSALLSLSTLSQSISLDTPDRNRRKPGPKPRRVPPFPLSESSLPSSGSEENEPLLSSTHKDGRPRNLGRGVSKPKKNTVASLLAQSRALDNHKDSPLGKSISPSPSLDMHSYLSSMYKVSDDFKSQCGDSISDDRSNHSHSEMSDSDSDMDRKSNADPACADGPGGKRRKIAVDEAKLKEALDKGWKRETYITGVNKGGIKGEVIYTSPCGRSFKYYSDLVRYLEKHNSDLGREHFSFSCRILLGDYIESAVGGKEQVRLSQETLAIKLGQVMQQYRAEKQRLAMEAKERKRIAREEAARQREQLRMIKEQERCERQEAARKEREQRNQQLLEGRKRLAFTSEEKWRIIREIESGKSKSDVSRELGLANSTVATIWKQRGNVMPTPGAGPARKKKQEELEKQRHELQQRKQQEREFKRQQAAIIKEQERERRRQHMGLVKALEVRKRHEEREKKRLEQRAEKLATREKRIEQRRQEIEILRELRKPVEDMELTDPKPLPHLERVPGLKLSGQAFADILMVHEFLHNFGETLGFDPESLPTLNSLQDALLGANEESEEELMSVISQLVICGVEDPGIPHPARHTTMLGHSLRQAEISHSSISEILRIYLYANATGELKATTGVHFEREKEKKVTEHHNNMGDCCEEEKNGKNSQFFTLLKENQTYKMSEWLKRKPFLALNPTQKAAIIAFLCHELLQNKAVIRQIDSAIDTVAQLKRERWPIEANLRKLRHLQNKKNKAAGITNNNNIKDQEVKSLLAEPEKDEFEGVEIESCNDSDITQPEEEELAKMNITESLAAVSKQADENNKAFSVYSAQLRATCLGQDRYHRRYWCLNSGFYIEGMESADPELYEEVAKRPLDVKEEIKEELKKEDVNHSMEVDGIKEENSHMTEVKKEIDEKMDVDHCRDASTTPMGTPIKDESLLSTPTDNHHDEKPLRFEKLGECLEKESVTSNGCQTSSMSEEVQWFSILPKEPCDWTSITQSAPGYRHWVDAAGDLRIPNVGSPCPSPLPLPLSVEEAALLDHCKAHGLPKPGKPTPIPKEAQKGWFKISSERMAEVLTSLEPRGLREREFLGSITRMRTDHTWEPTLKATGSRDPTHCDLRLTDYNPTVIPEADDTESWSYEAALRVDIAVLRDVEALEEKVASASMQLKGWKVPAKASLSCIDFIPSCVAPDSSRNPVEIGKERLLLLLENIEKRYLKPPLGNNGELKLKAEGSCGQGSGSSSSNGEDSDVAAPTEVKGLVVWRDALSKSQTAAQLALLTHALEASIAWDKSIMKANCQFCHSGDNEDKLLLCDGCDKGYHTYCFRPKIETIPEGDWYCIQCLNQAKGEKNCIVCGKKTGKNLLACDTCPVAYHTDCMIPPLGKVPRGKWYCNICITKHPKKKLTRRSATATSSPVKMVTPEPEPPPPPPLPISAPPTPIAENNITNNIHPEPVPVEPPPVVPPPDCGGVVDELAGGMRREKKRLSKELGACRQLLDELDAHEDAWPFLLAVNTKQFPTYRKIIRSPMDLQTIGKKLRDAEYKSREEFASDVRLIFDNCETFNEDNSPVGKAGHSLRLYFETRWVELTTRPPI